MRGLKHIVGLNGAPFELGKILIDDPPTNIAKLIVDLDQHTLPNSIVIPFLRRSHSKEIRRDPFAIGVQKLVKPLFFF